jgi:hypothetical protein
MAGEGSCFAGLPYALCPPVLGPGLGGSGVEVGGAGVAVGTGGGVAMGNGVSVGSGVAVGIGVGVAVGSGGGVAFGSAMYHSEAFQSSGVKALGQKPPISCRTAGNACSQ